MKMRRLKNDLEGSLKRINRHVPCCRQATKGKARSKSLASNL